MYLQYELYHAIRDGNIIKCDTILQNHSSFRYMDYFPLHIAIWYQQFDICSYLIKKMKEDNILELEINRYDECKHTPLFIASASGYYDICKLLINHGAKIDMVDYYGLTPFHIASINDKRDVCLLLIEHNANINTIDILGFSPLKDVCRKENHILIDLIITTNSKRTKKFTEQDMLQILDMFPNKHHNICPFLSNSCKKHTQECFATIHSLCINGKYEYCKKLVEKGISLNELNKELKSPLHLVCQYGHLELCSFLLKNGLDIDINALDNNNNTALHYACEQGSIGMCALLIHHGASLEIQNHMNQTPIVVASIYGHKHICRFLQKNGSNIYHKDIHDKSSIDYTLLSF